MSLKNNIVKIKRNTDKITSRYIEKEFKKLGFSNVLRWAIVEIDNDFLKINFSTF